MSVDEEELFVERVGVSGVAVLDKRGAFRMLTAGRWCWAQGQSKNQGQIVFRGMTTPSGLADHRYSDAGGSVVRVWRVERPILGECMVGNVVTRWSSP